MRRSRLEEQSQVALVSWFRLQYPKYKDLLTLGSIGENVGSRRMARLKQMGLTPGFPDIVIYVAKAYENFWYNGLFIEMKTKNGRLSPCQKQIHDLLKHQYIVITAHSFEEAQLSVTNYLDN